MKKTDLILITGANDSVITDFMWKLTQNMIPNSYLAFDGYKANEINSILKLNAESVLQPNFLIFGTSDKDAIDVVKQFNYSVISLTINP